MFEEEKSYLKAYIEQISEPSRKGGKGAYICPLCHSGEGRNRTGAFHIYDEIQWKCFSCDRGGDIFDLIGYVEGLVKFKDQLKRVRELFNLSTECDELKNQRTEYLNSNAVFPLKEEEKKDNYLSFYNEATKHLCETDYFLKRGLSFSTVQRFKVGYVKKWKHPKVTNPNVPETPRLIIPLSESCYFARDTREIVPGTQLSYMKQKVGGSDIFNKSELFKKSTDPIFIVEGEIDAMSIVEVGGKAVALGSIGNINKLINLISDLKIDRTFILSLDQDEKGREAELKLAEQFRSKKIKFISCKLTIDDVKDPNDMLVKNKGVFNKMVENAINQTKSEKERYLEYSTANHLSKFFNDITNGSNTSCIKTNFEGLDDLLEGGLYEGLYCVGAISSLGKTTFVTQIADQIAAQGTDVLIFSIEMSRWEIISKSISRHTVIESIASNSDIRNAKTARGITEGSRYSGYSNPEKDLIKKAVANYSQYCKNIYIVEGTGPIGVELIRKTVENHLKYTGKAPVVIIDYLQILYPVNERLTEKQNTDRSVIELKRISRDFKTPVIAISSFNRENYKSVVSMQSFKESGAIEYSSDVLIGLQLKGTGQGNFDVNEAKSRNPREIELVVLKNRNGRTSIKMEFDYYAMYNYFKEK